MTGSRDFRLRCVPPGANPDSTSSHAPSMTGTVARLTPLLAAMPLRWPRSPKPVMSVQALTPPLQHGLAGGAVQGRHDLDGAVQSRGVQKGIFVARARLTSSQVRFRPSFVAGLDCCLCSGNPRQSFLCLLGFLLLGWLRHKILNLNVNACISLHTFTVSLLRPVYLYTRNLLFLPYNLPMLLREI